MFLLFTILSKLMLVYCGMMIGAWIEYGYIHVILAGNSVPGQGRTYIQ